MLCWNLANENVDRANLMRLLFDKYKLLHYEDGVFKQPYPAAETYRRMTDALHDVEHIQRITVPEHPTLSLFEVQRREQSPLFVVWEQENSNRGA